ARACLEATIITGTNHVRLTTMAPSHSFAEAGGPNPNTGSVNEQSGPDAQFQIDNNQAFIFNAIKTGVKFQDTNANGVRDQGEPSLDEWTIQAYADTNNNNVIDQAEFNAGPVATDTTHTVNGADGAYSLSLAPGKYIVVEVLQSGWNQSFPDGNSVLANGLNTGAITLGSKGYAITLGSGTTDDGNDFGNHQNATKTGVKFQDTNANGVKD